MSVFAVEYVYDDRPEVRDVFRPEHRAFLSRLAERGEVIASGPLDGGAGALVIVDAASESAARDLLTGDPFAREGLITEVRVRAWVPVIGVLQHLV